MSAKNNIFQLSALSQNDPGAADGSELVCKIIKVENGILRQGSFPINENVKLPIPPGENKPAPATPSWFLVTTKGEDAIFEVEVFCSTDTKYPTKKIVVKQSDVRKWATISFEKRENQIYQKGEYGIFGFAQEGPDGLIYTITAGVLNPRLYGNEALV